MMQCYSRIHRTPEISTSSLQYPGCILFPVCVCPVIPFTSRCSWVNNTFGIFVEWNWMTLRWQNISVQHLWAFITQPCPYLKSDWLYQYVFVSIVTIHTLVNNLRLIIISKIVGYIFLKHVFVMKAVSVLYGSTLRTFFTVLETDLLLY